MAMVSKSESNALVRWDSDGDGILNLSEMRQSVSMDASSADYAVDFEIPIPNSVWFQYWRGKISGAIAQSLITMESKEVSVADCIATQGVVPNTFTISNKLCDTETVRLVVVVSIDGGPVTQAEKASIGAISRNALSDLRRRQYTWAPNAHIMWVHFPNTIDLLDSLQGARNLMLDEDSAKTTIESDCLRRNSRNTDEGKQWLLGTTYTVDPKLASQRNA